MQQIKKRFSSINTRQRTDMIATEMIVPPFCENSTTYKITNVFGADSFYFNEFRNLSVLDGT